MGCDAEDRQDKPSGVTCLCLLEVHQTSRPSRPLPSDLRSVSSCHLPFAILESVDSVDLNAKRSRSDYFFACPSANAWSKRRPGALKPIFSLTKRAASAAPYSRSMPGSSHSTESGPA